MGLDPEISFDFLEKSEEKIFLYQKDTAFYDNLNRYLRSVSKIPMFSKKEEIAAGKEILKRRKKVIHSLNSFETQQSPELFEIKKILNNSLPGFKSPRQNQKLLGRNKNIWEFIGAFIAEFSHWPSLKKISERLNETDADEEIIIQLVKTMRLENLCEEIRFRLDFLGKNPKRLHDLHPNIISKIRYEMKNEKSSKYWQANVFDELDTFKNLPQPISQTLKDLLDIENEFVKANLRLVVRVAKVHKILFYVPKLDFLDLIQEGNFGLYNAARRFDPTMGFKFSTFATCWVKQAIRQAIRNDSNIIRVPVHMLEKYIQILKVEAELTENFERKPSPEEIVEEFKTQDNLRRTNLAHKLTPKKVREILNIARVVYSLDRQMKKTDEYSDASFGDFIPDTKTSSPEDNMRVKDLEEAIDNIFSNILDEREIHVINLRFGRKGNETHTLEEVGAKFSLTRERIRQIENTVFKKLRHPNKKIILKHFLS